MSLTVCSERRVRESESEREVIFSSCVCSLPWLQQQKHWAIYRPPPHNLRLPAQTASLHHSSAASPHPASQHHINSLCHSIEIIILYIQNDTIPQMSPQKRWQVIKSLCLQESIPTNSKLCVYISLHFDGDVLISIIFFIFYCDNITFLMLFNLLKIIIKKYII